MATAATDPRLIKLLSAQRELLDKFTAIQEEIDAIVAGRAGIGQQLKAAEAAFDQVWCARYAPGQTGAYVWSFQKDRAHLKRLIRQIGLEELKVRALNYLANEDPFYARARHSFGMFVSSINAHASESTEAPAFELGAPGPSDCRHTPRCKDDAEHTRRRRLDRQAASA